MMFNPYAACMISVKNEEDQEYDMRGNYVI
jgi:hypothetical protein